VVELCRSEDIALLAGLANVARPSRSRVAQLAFCPLGRSLGRGLYSYAWRPTEPPRCELLAARSFVVVGAGRCPVAACRGRSRPKALLYSCAVRVPDRPGWLHSVKPRIRAGPKRVPASPCEVVPQVRSALRTCGDRYTRTNCN